MSRRKSGAPGLALWLALAALVVVFDQFTKQLILGNYQLGDSTYVTSFFNIVRAHNTGAAFSFLAGAGGWQRWFFVALAVAASLFIVWL
ncbi:MAG: signal peptidase II, partial [Ottowia sp.]|nr:signal peptidase II [Ottowia sp.]